MPNSTELPSLQIAVRTEPVQQRSSDRITLLLDVAAAIIDDKGIDGLTTSEVAARSGSSVGVVYRYFPNIQSLLRALAARNMHLYTDRVFAALSSDATQWLDAVDEAIDAYADLNRQVSGFRALRFGDVIAERFLDPQLSNNTVLAHAFAGLLGEKYDFAHDETLVFELEVVIEIVDALMKRAFLMDRNGDEKFIAKAREISASYLHENTALPSHQ